MSIFRKQLHLIFLLFCSSLSAQLSDFIPNAGQWDENVLMKADIQAGAVFLEKGKLTFSFYNPQFFENLHEGKVDSILHCHAFSVAFIGSNPAAKLHLSEFTKGYYNYFLGNDPKKWASKLKGGQKATYKELYPNIDLVLYAGTNGVKYEFVVKPGGDPSLIRYQINGASELSLFREQIKITTSVNEVIDQAPVSFQKGKKILTDYLLKQNEVSFAFKTPYNKNDTLIIDPHLVFSTFSGSFANNFGYTATYDRFGFLYAGGSVFGVGYPTTLGAFDLTFNSDPPTGNWGVSDIGITKYDTSGTFRVYSTYIGGKNSELPHSLIVNSKDELYIFGTTGSADYPVTPNAYDNTFAGGTAANYANGIFVNFNVGTDIIVSKLSASGTAMLGSTYLGGSGNDGLNHNLVANYADQMRGEIILDENEQIIVATSTHSNDLPVSAGAFQSNLAGGQDGVVFKMNDNLTNLQWLSYFGGNGNDGIYSVIKSNDNQLFIAGGTLSNNLPINTTTAFQATRAGHVDGFFAKISADGQNILEGSYYGSNVYDQTYFIRQDRDNYVYLLSQSLKGGTFFINNAAYAITNSGGVITKFNPSLDTLIWSTTFGNGAGGIGISPTAFLVDLCNKVYLSGWGTVTGYPITANAYQSSTVSGDFYLMVLEDDASALHYGTYFGGPLSGEHVDGGTSRFDPKGVVYQSVCAGCQNNSDFPFFPDPGGVSKTNNSGSCNNGVFKFNLDIPTIVADFALPELACFDTNYTFINTSRILSATTYEWDFGDNSVGSTVKTPTHQYVGPGTYTIKLIIRDSTSCNLIDSISKTIVLRADTFYVSGGDTVCFGDSLQVNLALEFPDSASYLWQPGIPFSDSTMYLPKLYTETSRDFRLLVHTGPGCTDTVSYPVLVPDYTLSFSDTIACLEDTISVYVNSHPDFVTYHWSNASDFSNQINTSLTDTAFQYVVPATDTLFYVRVTDIHGCEWIDSLAIISKHLILQLSPDTIVCDQTPILRSIISPHWSLLDSIAWSPALNVVQGADSSIALLSIYAYLSDYLVFARDTFGCEAIDSIRIVDNSLDLDLPDTLICFGDTLDLGFQLDYNPLFNYEWLPNDSVFQKDSLRTQTHPSTTIQLNLIVNNSFCIDTVGQLVTVSRVLIDGVLDTVLCNITGNFFAQVTGPDSLTYKWSNQSNFGTVLQEGGGLKTYSFNPVFGAQTLYVEARNSLNCTDSAELRMNNIFYDLAYPSSATACFADTLNVAPLNPASEYANSTFLWQPGTLVLNNDSTASSVSVNQTTGSYQLTVYSQNNLACKDTDVVVLNFAELDTSEVSASIDPVLIVRGETATITVLPSPYIYSLEPDEFESFLGNKFYVKPNESTTYTVKVSDNQFPECNASAKVQIEVLPFICMDPYIYLPNAFSPNGDGENDVLYVRGKNLTKLYLAIYNRWGEKVFETENQHNGWDGTYKGMQIDPAVYDYYMTWECEPGREYFKKGNITLIR